MIHGPPEVVPFTVYLHEHLIEVPFPAALFHARNTPLPELRSKHRVEPLPPEARIFVPDVDAKIVQQVLNLTKGKRKSYLEHHRWANDLRRKREVFAVGAFGHVQRLATTSHRLRPTFSDSTI